jgi:hypothetical protein
LIQKNSFVLEKDWNYIVLDWKTCNYKLDGILNKSENRTNGFTIKEYYLLIIQFKFFLFLMILKIVVNLQILHIIIIGDSSYMHILSNVIEYWLKITYKHHCWRTKIQNLLERDYLNLLLQQRLSSVSRNYSVIFFKPFNHQYYGNLFTTFKLNQLLTVLTITDVNYRRINLELINSGYIIGILNLMKNINENFLIVYSGMIINTTEIIDNNNRNSPLIVGVNFLRCLYPLRLAGTLAVT